MPPLVQGNHRMTTLTVPAEQARPGDVVGATARDTLVTGPIDHGTHVAFVARCRNGVPVIRTWDTGTMITVTREDTP